MDVLLPASLNADSTAAQEAGAGNGRPRLSGRATLDGFREGRQLKHYIAIDLVDRAPPQTIESETS